MSATAVGGVVGELGRRVRALPWARVGHSALLCLGWLARGALGAIGWTSRAGWTHRRPLIALGVRAAWVAALLVLVSAGRPLLDVTATLDVDGTLTRFGVGLALCAFTVILARARRLRWAAIVLGAAHGLLALALWSAAAPV